MLRAALKERIPRYMKPKEQGSETTQQKRSSSSSVYHKSRGELKLHWAERDHTATLKDQIQSIRAGQEDVKRIPLYSQLGRPSSALSNTGNFFACATPGGGMNFTTLRRSKALYVAEPDILSRPATAASGCGDTSFVPFHSGDDGTSNETGTTNPPLPAFYTSEGGGFGADSAVLFSNSDDTLPSSSSGMHNVSAVSVERIDKLLPRPMSTGLLYASSVANFEELVSRRILEIPDDEKTHLSQADVELLYQAKCEDQICPSTFDRRNRFFHFLSEQCRGQWFVLRQCGLAAKSCEAIAEILMKDENYTHLDLSGNDIGVEGAKHIGRLIAHNTNLCVLRVQSANLGSGIDEIVDSLHKNKTLTALDFSGISGIHRNTIWGKSARSLGYMLQLNAVISYLNLASCGLQKTAGLLIRSCVNHLALTHLDLTGNKIKDDICPIFSDFFTNGQCALLTLKLDQNMLTCQGIEHMCEGLRSGGVAASSLQHLSLSGNKIGVKGAHALALVVGDSGCHLTTLNVSHNMLCNSGVDEDGYRIANSSEGVSEIFKSLERNKHLRTLKLNDCGIESLPPSVVSGVAKSAALTALDVSSNKFGDEGGERMAEALKANRELHAINLNGCAITTKSGTLLASAIEHHPELTTLYIQQHGLDLKASGLIDAVKVSHSLLTVDYTKDAMAEVASTLQRNQKLKILRAAPELENSHAALEKEKQTYVATQDAIVDEQKRREKMADNFKVMREKQKAGLNAYKNEIQELQDQRDRGEHVQSTLENQLQEAEEVNSQARRKMDIEMGKLKKGIETVNNDRDNFRKQISKARMKITNIEGEEVRNLEMEMQRAITEMEDQKSMGRIFEKRIAELETKTSSAKKEGAGSKGGAKPRKGSAKGKKK